MNNAISDKKERRRIIIIMMITGALILVLLAAVIMAAFNKPKQQDLGSDENSEFILDDGDNAQNSTEDSEENKVAEDEQSVEESQSDTALIGKISTETTDADYTSDSSSTVIDYKEETLSIDESLPNTGAENFLPLALILGLLAANISLAILSRQEA